MVVVLVAAAAGVTTAGVTTAVVSNTAGVTTAVVSNTAGVTTAVVSNTAGVTTAVVSNTAGVLVLFSLYLVFHTSPGWVPYTQSHSCVAMSTALVISYLTSSLLEILEKVLS